MGLRNPNVDFCWANYLVNIKHNNDPEAEYDRIAPEPKNRIIANDGGSTLFWRRWGNFYKIQDILPKLQLYDQITDKNHLLVNWGEVFILPDRKSKMRLIWSVAHRLSTIWENAYAGKY